MSLVKKVNFVIIIMIPQVNNSIEIGAISGHLFTVYL